MNIPLAKRQQNAKETLTHLTQVMERMLADMQRKSSGKELQILQVLVRAMQVAAAALSLPYTGSAPLFLGLTIASHGIYTSESEAGIIGPSIARLMQAFSDGIIAELMPQVDVAKRRLLTLAITACYAFFTCLSCRAADHGIGPFDEELGKADLKAAHVFGFELVLLLINSSGAVEEVYRAIIEACGGDKEKAQKIGAPLLAQIGNLLMIFAGTEGSLRKPAEIIGEQGKYVQRGIIAATKAMSKSSENDTSSVAAASVALTQLQIALDEENYEGCMETLNTLLENLGISPDALHADIKQLKKTTRMIAEAFLQEHEEPFTSAIHVA